MSHFQSIKDPLDEALKTKFICSVENEAGLKPLFKLRWWAYMYIHLDIPKGYIKKQKKLQIKGGYRDGLWDRI